MFIEEKKYNIAAGLNGNMGNFCLGDKCPRIANRRRHICQIWNINTHFVFLYTWSGHPRDICALLKLQ